MNRTRILLSHTHTHTYTHTAAQVDSVRSPYTITGLSFLANKEKKESCGNSAQIEIFFIFVGLFSS